MELVPSTGTRGQATEMHRQPRPDVTFIDLGLEGRDRRNRRNSRDPEGISGSKNHRILRFDLRRRFRRAPISWRLLTTHCAWPALPTPPASSTPCALTRRNSRTALSCFPALPAYGLSSRRHSLPSRTCRTRCLRLRRPFSCYS
jgi:hypothetical protein